LLMANLLCASPAFPSEADGNQWREFGPL
jgi:hypothetical protein